MRKVLYKFGTSSGVEKRGICIYVWSFSHIQSLLVSGWMGLRIIPILSLFYLLSHSIHVGSVCSDRRRMNWVETNEFFFLSSLSLLPIWAKWQVIAWLAGWRHGFREHGLMI